MSKEIHLKDRNTGEILYPNTKADLVAIGDKSVEDVLNEPNILVVELQAANSAPAGSYALIKEAVQAGKSVLVKYKNDVYHLGYTGNTSYYFYAVTKIEPLKVVELCITKDNDVVMKEATSEGGSAVATYEHEQELPSNPKVGDMAIVRANEAYSEYYQPSNVFICLNNGWNRIPCIFPDNCTRYSAQDGDFGFDGKKLYVFVWGLGWKQIEYSKESEVLFSINYSKYAESFFGFGGTKFLAISQSSVFANRFVQGSYIYVELNVESNTYKYPLLRDYIKVPHNGETTLSASGVVAIVQPLDGVTRLEVHAAYCNKIIQDLQVSDSIYSNTITIRIEQADKEDYLIAATDKEDLLWMDFTNIDSDNGNYCVDINTSDDGNILRQGGYCIALGNGENIRSFLFVKDGEIVEHYDVDGKIVIEKSAGKTRIIFLGGQANKFAFIFKKETFDSLYAEKMRLQSKQGVIKEGLMKWCDEGLALWEDTDVNAGGDAILLLQDGNQLFRWGDIRDEIKQMRLEDLGGTYYVLPRKFFKYTGSFHLSYKLIVPDELTRGILQYVTDSVTPKEEEYL